MKRIAAITMVRNDDFFLSKWVGYYGRQLGKENLHVIFDGLDQKVPEFCDGVNVERVEHVKGNVHEADRGRIDLISQRAARLFDRYDMVIGTDVDEFLVVDPLLGQTLAQFLSGVTTGLSSISGLGVDVGQKIGEEADIDASRPFLSQRSYAKLSTRYSKASVLLRPVAWGSGFHRTRRGNFHIVKDLYLFHFGCVDLERLKSKMHNADLLSNGWSRHLKKRARTMLIVTHGKARAWESLVPVMRRLQTLFRPVYAWNKPTVFGLKFVVKIPDRFSEIV